MKKSAYALCALMVLQGAVMAETAAVPTTATQTKTKTVTTKTVTAQTMKARGEVVSVDAVGNTLTIKNHKGESTFAVSSNAKITSGKKDVKLADLAAGSHVSVMYAKDGATMTASAIKVMPLMAKKAPAPAVAPKK